MNGNLIIDIHKGTTEGKVIETCLAYWHSGYNYKVLLSLYALAKGWKITKLLNYIKLIEDE